MKYITFQNPSENPRGDATPHAPTICKRDVLGTQYIGKGYKSKFVCPKCGASTWQHLSYLGQRDVICNRRRFTKEKRSYLNPKTKGLYCEHCNKQLDKDKTIYLELSETDGKYYAYGLPKGHKSQGGFPFGNSCAKQIAVDFNTSKNPLIYWVFENDNPKNSASFKSETAARRAAAAMNKTAGYEKFRVMSYGSENPSTNISIRQKQATGEAFDMYEQGRNTYDVKEKLKSLNYFNYEIIKAVKDAKKQLRFLGVTFSTDNRKNKKKK